MTTKWKRSVAGLVLACMVGPRVAGAQGVRSPAAAAEVFKKGREAVKRGDYKAAHDLFEESYALDPAAGTLLNLADAEERLGMLIAAAEHYRLAATGMASNDDRRPIVEERLRQLEPRFARFAVPTVAEASGQAVVVDGTLLFRAQAQLTMIRGRVFQQDQHLPLDEFRRIDPGRHEAYWLVTVGGTNVEVTLPFTLAEGETRRLAIPDEVGEALANERSRDSAALAEDADEQVAEHAAALKNRLSLPEVESSKGVTLRFRADAEDGWYVAGPANQTLCSLPCERVVPPDTTLRLGRANNQVHTVVVSTSGHPPGSVVDVTPHAPMSFGTGILLLFGGLGVSLGAGIGGGAACKDDGCSAGVETAVIATSVAGGAAFITGTVWVILAGMNAVASADVERVAKGGVRPQGLGWSW